MAVFLDVAPGDRVLIGGNIVDVQEKSGRRTRLRIDSHADVKHQKAEAESVPSVRPTNPVTLTRPPPK